MLPNKLQTKLTDKQKRVLQMRYQYGWPLKRIALALGTTPGCVSRLLQRAHAARGLPRKTVTGVRLQQPRVVRAGSLSSMFNY